MLDEMHRAWVEADKSVKHPHIIIGYSVWHYHFNEFGECVERCCLRHFSITRKGGWMVAHKLAFALRDDINQGVE